jgi:hypothetical protein
MVNSVGTGKRLLEELEARRMMTTKVPYLVEALMLPI